MRSLVCAFVVRKQHSRGGGAYDAEAQASWPPAWLRACTSNESSDEHITFIWAVSDRKHKVGVRMKAQYIGI